MESYAKIFHSHEDVEGEAEGELIMPASEEEDEDEEVISVIEEDVSTSILARNAASSAGLSRPGTSAPPIRVTTTQPQKRLLGLILAEIALQKPVFS